MADTTIRLKALDGTWETCGVDRIPAVVPESVVLDSDDWGSKGARFDLKRDPSQVWPDIGAFTPVKIDVDGSPSWSGRVSETPSRDGTDMVMSVACEGRQHELDDDMVERVYVHNRLSDWQDMRSALTADIGSGAGQACAAGVVSVANGGTTLQFPKGQALAAYAKVGVQLDLGPNSTAIRAVVNFTSSGTAGYKVYCRNNTASTLLTGANTLVGANISASSPIAGTGASAGRYVWVFMEQDSAGAVTPANDVSVTLQSVQVFAVASYESGNTSNLKASTVISDVLDRATPLLSTDRSGITATSFNVPALAPSDPQTARDFWQAVNAYHGWMSKVDVDGRPVFQAVPSRPKYQIGEWSAAEISDSSANSGQDIFNKVIVTGTDPAGQPVRVVRTSGNATTVSNDQSDVVITNPSFDTNTTGWNGLSLTRTTTGGEYESGPGGGKIAVLAGGFYPQDAATTGTAKLGHTYVLTARVRLDTAGPQTALCSVSALNTAGTLYRTPVTSVNWTSNTGFVTATMVWTPTADEPSPTFRFEFLSPANGTFFIDSLSLRKRGDTLVDRRRFRRAKQLAVNSVLPSDGIAAAAIGDVWLQNHITTPFRGSVVLTGKDALRNRLSGQSVPLAALLRDTGELLELTDRPDPDTGATTRKGRITTVSYVPALDQATVALDSTRANLDNLLNRLAATG